MYLGYDVTFVSNYTDVDDKIIAKAQKEGKTEIEISNRYIAEFKNSTFTTQTKEAIDTSNVSNKICLISDNDSIISWSLCVWLTVTGLPLRLTLPKEL